MGLAAFVGLYERHLPNSLEARHSSAGLIAPFDGKELQRIEVSGPAGNCKLERVGEEWRLIEPIADRANPDTMKQLIRALERLVIRESIEQSEIGVEDGPKLEDLGFGDAESIRANLTFNDGSKPLTLVFGSDAAVEGVVYLQTAGSGWTAGCLPCADNRATLSDEPS